MGDKVTKKVPKEDIFPIPLRMVVGGGTAGQVKFGGAKTYGPSAWILARSCPNGARGGGSFFLSDMKMLKSIFGLAEAPRLWYLRAFLEAEIGCLTFYTQDPKTGGIYALRGLRVDNGMLCRNPKYPTFTKIDSRFNSKEQLNLANKMETFLGVGVKIENGTVVGSMKHVSKMKPVPVKSNGEEGARRVPELGYADDHEQMLWRRARGWPQRLIATSTSGCSWRAAEGGPEEEAQSAWHGGR
ncbi:unnamed protein product [Effrenium voratum]|nr:unnamed protein product [Effrenium voratum]